MPRYRVQYNERGSTEFTEIDDDAAVRHALRSAYGRRVLEVYEATTVGQVDHLRSVVKNPRLSDGGDAYKGTDDA